MGLKGFCLKCWIFRRKILRTNEIPFYHLSAPGLYSSDFHDGNSILKSCSTKTQWTGINYLNVYKFFILETTDSVFYKIRENCAILSTTSGEPNQMLDWKRSIWVGLVWLVCEFFENYCKKIKVLETLNIFHSSTDEISIWQHLDDIDVTSLPNFRKPHFGNPWNACIEIH